MQVLSRATAMVLASRQEPFGIVVLEAGVLGIPVVASTVCGVVKLIEAERELIAVAPDDAAALADAVLRVVTDEALAARLTVALRSRVCVDFTWEHVGPQYSGKVAAVAASVAAD